MQFLGAVIVAWHRWSVTDNFDIYSFSTTFPHNPNNSLHTVRSIRYRLTGLRRRSVLWEKIQNFVSWSANFLTLASACICEVLQDVSSSLQGWSKNRPGFLCLLGRVHATLSPPFWPSLYIRTSIHTRVLAPNMLLMSERAAPKRANEDHRPTLKCPYAPKPHHHSIATAQKIRPRTLNPPQPKHISHAMQFYAISHIAHISYRVRHCTVQRWPKKFVLLHRLRETASASRGG